MDVYVNAARERDQLADELGLPARSFFTCEAGQLAHLLRDVVRRGDPMVGVAGGDGTMRAAAAALAGTGTALLPVPTGTLNHFARALGIDGPQAAAAAAARGVTTEVDLAEANGHVFCNNATSGWYPEMVKTRDDLDTWMPKRVATALAAVRHLGTIPALHIELDGSAISRSWMVWVGCGEYGTTPATLTDRPSLTSGVLDARVLDRDTTLPRLRAMWHLAMHQLDDTEIVDRRLVPSLVVRSRSRHLSLALDGDVVRMRAPLRFRVLPRALRVVDGRADG